MNQNINIHWFRQDLRLNDNPSLFNAAKNSNLLPIYIYDNKNQEKFHIGNASKVWLYYSLKSLNNSLDGKLHVLKKGDVVTVESEVRHEFSTKNGCVIEEVSSTHYIDDSYYTDDSISANKNRKTHLTQWTGWDLLKENNCK